MKSITTSKNEIKSQSQESSETETAKAIQIKSRNPILRAAELEKSLLPAIFLKKNSTNFKASFMSVLENKVPLRTQKKNIVPKLRPKKTQKRNSFSCPVEPGLKDSMVLNPMIFERLCGKPNRVCTKKIRRPDSSTRGQSLAPRHLNNAQTKLQIIQPKKSTERSLTQLLIKNQNKSSKNLIQEMQDLITAKKKEQ